ncbi:MAG: linear amide C-N hydrolase [Ruminococcus sp.]
MPSTKRTCIAGLNFVEAPAMLPDTDDSDNVAIEFIRFSASAPTQARALSNSSTLDTPFMRRCWQLHWIIADKNQTITVESMADGIHVYENPVGVLTNNPPFPEQMFRLNDYMHLSPKQPQNHFSTELPLKSYSRGMGALGLPGDLSSQSRFVRAAFVRANSVSGNSETESVSQFFHILGAVDQQRGCCEVKDGQYEITIYTSCCNADKGIYYYTTYNNHQISAVHMHHENLDSSQLVCCPMQTKEQICHQN